MLQHETLRMISGGLHSNLNMHVSELQRGTRVFLPFPAARSNSAVAEPTTHCSLPRMSAGGGGHSHTRSCACDHDEGDADGESLLPSINLDHVSAQNERVRGSARGVFRAFERRHEVAAPCESNPEDPDLIITVPFTSAVRVKSISILGASEGTTPLDVHLFVNRDDSA